MTMNRTETALLAARIGPHHVVTDLRGVLPVNETKKWSHRSVAKITGMCYHHAAAAVGNLSDVAYLKLIAKYHAGPNHISESGCPAICYTLAVGSEGSVYILNDFNDRTWSQNYAKIAGDENSLYMGVMFCGNFWSPDNPQGDEPTLKQLQAATDLFRWFSDAWGFTGVDLFGHFIFGKPACPGTALQNIVESIRGRVKTAGASHRVAETVIDLDSDAGRQTALHMLKASDGYPYYIGAIDGLWGNVSKAALVAFQRDHGLTVDGIWGNQVDAAIRDALDALNTG